jgi:hypothetical protein
MIDFAATLHHHDVGRMAANALGALVYRRIFYYIQ